MPNLSRRTVALILCLVVATPAFADLRITLKRPFVEQYKDRATIQDVTFTVDAALDHAKTVGKGSNDGDVHIAGRSTKVGLPMVAEILNGRLEKTMIDTVQDALDHHKTLTISGVWRIWAEHGGNTDQTQGATVKPAEDTNPDHIFEIHPITALNGTDLSHDTFVPITSSAGKSFEYKDAEAAFHAYENVPSHITFTNSTVTVRTRMAGYNYVEFLLKPVEKPRSIVDGSTLFANVLDLDGELVVRHRRKCSSRERHHSTPVRPPTPTRRRFTSSVCPASTCP
jgi:hypothetical protein